MAVVIETTLGDITVDLYLDRRPVTCLNFLKLCKMKYYNFNLFHTIRSGFIAQTGDPSGEGSGGSSIWGILEGSEKRFFSAEKMPKIRHTDAGLLSMVCTDDMMVGSQFFITLASNLDSLDGVHCVIGEVTEGHEVLRKLNEVICDETHRPYRDVRITHTVVLEDPFNDPPGLRAPSRSPSPNTERLKGGRIAPDEQLDETEGKSAAEIQEMIEEKEAKARATILEIVGDLPDADIAPPENVLFVCKLNPVTSDEDLEIIFSRFGKIVSCEVIRDRKTGDSLQYAFIEFTDKKSCENAYFKMDNVLIDDRRIHVDFSQSVSKIQWLGKGRGVRHIKDGNDNDGHVKKSRRSESRERNKTDYHHHNKNRDKDEEKQSHHKHRSRDTDKYSGDRQKSERKSRYERSQRDRVRSTIDNGRDDRQTKHEKNEQNVSKDDRRNRNHKREYNNTGKEEKEKHDYRKTYSPIKRSSPPRKSRNESLPAKKDYKNYKSRDDSRDTRENLNHKTKIKKSTKDNNGKTSKRSHDELTPRTPSPVLKNKNGNINDKKKRKSEIDKKKSQIKKKRVESTSSSSDSESSSETSTSDSSSTSSSSSVDTKRKRSHRKKKYSSSSSSESSSTSSSDSSTSSSSSSDSESDRKKSKKKGKKVKVKNSKKKL